MRSGNTPRSHCVRAGHTRQHQPCAVNPLPPRTLPSKTRRERLTLSIPSKTNTPPFFAALTAAESVYTNPLCLRSLPCFNSASPTSRWRVTISRGLLRSEAKVEARRRPKGPGEEMRKISWPARARGSQRSRREEGGRGTRAPKASFCSIHDKCSTNSASLCQSKTLRANLAGSRVSYTGRETSPTRS